jgi:hypothetical protein
LCGHAIAAIELPNFAMACVAEHGSDPQAGDRLSPVNRQTVIGIIEVNGKSDVEGDASLGVVAICQVDHRVVPQRVVA